MQAEDTSANSTPMGDKDVILEKNNRAGIITLNRPTALNALTNEMLMEIDAFYVDCRDDPHIYGIVLQSGSDRAFCAGGDLRAYYTLMEEPGEVSARFFETEYQHTWTLERYTKPNVALMNGVTFGGGVGVSLYGTHCVAGENYSFAMPETKIGFIPDIGSTFVLSRMANFVGYYIALTGNTIGIADAYKLKLITHFIPSDHYDEIRDAMIESDPIDPVLEGLHQDPGEGDVEKAIPWISACFSAGSVEEILQRLDEFEGEGADWARQTAADLRARSPLALKLTFRHLKEALGDKSLNETLHRDFRLGTRFLNHGEFKEGIRALMIDKDQSPKWSHSDVSEVLDAEIERFFDPNGVPALALKDHGWSL